MTKPWLVKVGVLFIKKKRMHRFDTPSLKFYLHHAKMCGCRSKTASIFSDLFADLCFLGSSDISSDKFSIEQKKTAEHFVYLNNHKQIYNNEQQFSISCMGALQP